MPLLWLSAAFILGILAGAVGALPAIAWFGLSAASLGLGAAAACLTPRLAGAVSRFPERFQGWIRQVGPPGFTAAYLCLLLAAFFLGAGRMQGDQPIPQPDWIATYNDTPGPLWLTGILVKPPDVRDGYTLLTVQAESLRLAGSLFHTSVNGLVLVRASADEGIFQYGDRVVFNGYLKTPPENPGFSYRETLEKQGIFSMMSYPEAGRLGSGRFSAFRQGIAWMQTQALKTIYRLFPDPEASLLAGILLGVESGIPRKVQQAFQETGTGHIIAISGFNMAIIASLAALFFTRWWGRWPGTVAAILAVGVYAIFVGGNPPVIRAALMGILVVFGRRLGFSGVVYNSLAVVAAGMAFVTPAVLWDVGFQLSFAATAGIVTLGIPLGRWFSSQLSRFFSQEQAHRIAGPVSDYLLITLAAQLAVTPVLVYHFQRLSLTSLLANPLILPAQPLLMGLAGITLILGMIFLPLGQAAAPVAALPATYTIRVVEAIARWPGGEILTGPVSSGLAVLAVGLIFGLPAAWSRWEQVRNFLQPKKWLASPILVVGGILLTAWVWRLALARPDGRLRLHFWDVGTGEAMFIQTPDGKHILVNGGPAPTLLSDALGRALPPGTHSLDLLVISSTQEQHLGALPTILERFPPKQSLWSGVTTASYAARQTRAFLAEMGIPITEASPGQVFQLDQDCFLHVLSAGRLGAVLLLEYRDFRALLPTGLTPDGLASVDWSPVTVLLAPGSGKAALADPAWLAQLRPQLIVLSVAAGDRDGLPEPGALKAFQPYHLLRTDLVGWIEITTDGTQMWLETGK